MATRKRGSDRLNKSEFVRSLPEHMSAKEVVERGRAAGLALTPAYVYSIRTAARARTKHASGRSDESGPSTGRIEDLLRAVAAEIGLSRAIHILRNEQAKVRAVLGET